MPISFMATWLFLKVEEKNFLSNLIILYILYYILFWNKQFFVSNDKLFIITDIIFITHKHYTLIIAEQKQYKTL